jgi:hypothetical protein
MGKILITEAGVSPTENLIRSWNMAEIREEIIGISRNPYQLYGSKADVKKCIPYDYAFGDDYKEALLKIMKEEKPDLAVFMSDREILEVSKFREEIVDLGTKVFIPRHEVIDKCTDKFKSYTQWKKAGIKVPETIMIKNKQDLRAAFEKLGNEEGKVWIRSTIGAGGRGALPTNDLEFAAYWIDLYDGWGKFTASELLKSEKTVTWLSIWYEGELIVAQTRKRKSWGFGNRTLSGVTGITSVGETYSNKLVDKIAVESILAVDDKPHGVYGVDMTYDNAGIPNPTEINMRFFTTSHFFTEAGLNMAEIYKDIAIYGKFPTLTRNINPLPDGLIWLRDMDRRPVLTTMDQIRQIEISKKETFI